MKKTLIMMASLAALAGAASGATVVSDAVVGYEYFANGTTPTYGQSTLTLGANSSIDGGVFDTGDTVSTLTGPATTNYQGQIGGRSVMTVSMAFDLSGFVLPSSGTTYLFRTEPSNSTGTGWGLSIDSTGALWMTWRGASYGTVLGNVSSYIGAGADSLYLSFVTGYYVNGASGTDGSRLYIGDNGTFYSNTGLKFNNDIATLSIGGSGAVIEQFYVHNYAMTADQVGNVIDYMKNAVNPVPEPAAAAFGLLGLAGLMVRRRK